MKNNSVLLLGTEAATFGLQAQFPVHYTHNTLRDMSFTGFSAGQGLQIPIDIAD